ncbi:MAG: hypothetical protein ACKOUR_03845 [Planctomycetota bacterium]
MSFDPYHTWLGIAPSEQPATLYRLLGVAEFESNREVITNAADRQMRHVHSMNIGPHAALSQKLLGEIAQARLKLLDPDQKLRYDAQLLQAKQAAASAAAASAIAINPAPITSPITPAPVLPAPTATRRLLADDPSVTAAPRPATSAAARPVPMAAKPHAAAATNTSAPITSEPRPAIRRTRPKKNPLVEVARIILGGAVGLGIGALILWGLGKTPVDVASNITGRTAGEQGRPQVAQESPQPADRSTPQPAPKSVPQSPAPDTIKPPPPDPSTLKPSAPAPTTKTAPKPDVPSAAAAPHGNSGKIAPLPVTGRGTGASSSANSRAREPIPTTDQLTAARQAIQELYGDRYQVCLGKMGSERYDALVELAGELDTIFEDEKDLPTSYGLLELIGQVGSSAGATKLTLESVDKMHSVFAVDRDALYLEQLKKLVATLRQEDVGREPHAQHALDAAQAIVALAERSEGEERYERAVETWKLLAESRQGLAFEGMQASVIDQRLKRAQTSVQAVQELAEKLKELMTSPADAALNLQVGKLYCFQLQQWERGAPYLAKSDQEKVKVVGEREVSQPESAADREALGDVWSEWAGTLQDDERVQAEFRASEWYRLALRQVSGLAKVKLQRKLDTLTKTVTPTDVPVVSNDTKKKTTSRNSESLEGDEVILTVDLTQPFVLTTCPMPPATMAKNVQIQVLDIESPGGAQVRGSKNSFDLKSKFFIDFKDAKNVWLEAEVEQRNREIHIQMTPKCRYQDRGLEYPFTFETLDYAQKNSESAVNRARNQADRARTQFEDYQRQMKDKNNTPQRAQSFAVKSTEQSRLRARAEAELLEWTAIRQGLPKANEYAQEMHSKVRVYLLVKTVPNR